jgi:glycine cleavage system H lipoate-binding protein
MNVPKNLFYSKDHEWIKIEGNKATIGITDFAQNQLGDVVFVETPAPQTALKAGDSMWFHRIRKSCFRRLRSCKRYGCRCEHGTGKCSSDR